MTNPPHTCLSYSVEVICFAEIEGTTKALFVKHQEPDSQYHLVGGKNAPICAADSFHGIAFQFLDEQIGLSDDHIDSYLSDFLTVEDFPFYFDEADEQATQEKKHIYLICACLLSEEGVSIIQPKSPIASLHWFTKDEIMAMNERENFACFSRLDHVYDTFDLQNGQTTKIKIMISTWHIKE